MRAPKGKRLVRGFAIGAALIGVGFAVANIVDCVRYHRAIARVRSLSPDQLRAIGDYCRNVDEHARFESADAPEVFRPLRPTGGAVFKRNAEARVYEQGDAMVWLHVHTFPENQRIRWSSNVSGPTRTTVLWEQNPAAFSKLNPSGRLVTIVQWQLRDWLEWVVLDDQLCVFRRSSMNEASNALLAAAPLRAEDKAEIVRAIRDVKATAGGKDFRDDGSADGTELHIAFSSDGNEGPDDIVLANVWVDVVGPFYDIINRYAPRDYRLKFRDVVSTDPPAQRPSITVRTLKEYDRVFSPPPRTPWWCVWRAFAL